MDRQDDRQLLMVTDSHLDCQLAEAISTEASSAVCLEREDGSLSAAKEVVEPHEVSPPKEGRCKFPVGLSRRSLSSISNLRSCQLYRGDETTAGYETLKVASVDMTSASYRWSLDRNKLPLDAGRKERKVLSNARPAETRECGTTKNECTAV